MWQIFRETRDLYILTWNDREEAARTLERIDEIIRLRKEANEKATTAGEKVDEEALTRAISAEAEQKFPLLKPEKSKYKSAREVAQELYEKRDDLKDYVADRLQTISESLVVMLQSYREARELAKKEMVENDEFVKRFTSILNDDATTSNKIVSANTNINTFDNNNNNFDSKAMNTNNNIIIISHENVNSSQRILSTTNNDNVKVYDNNNNKNNDIETVNKSI